MKKEMWQGKRLVFRTSLKNIPPIFYKSQDDSPLWVNV